MAILAITTAKSWTIRKPTAIRPCRLSGSRLSDSNEPKHRRLHRHACNDISDQHLLAQPDEDGSDEGRDQQQEGDLGERSGHGLAPRIPPPGQPPRRRSKAFSSSSMISSPTPTTTMRRPQSSGSASVWNSCCITGAYVKRSCSAKTPPTAASTRGVPRTPYHVKERAFRYALYLL